jgi:hypothetical protein
VAAAFVVAIGGRAEADGHLPTRTYRVTVENLTENQLLTPAVVATHTPKQSVFRSGEKASDGLQQLAENGGVPVLAAELEAAGVSDVQVAGTAPLEPGEKAEVLITADPGVWRLSAAAMLICTNDGFGGVRKLTLPHTFGEVRAVYGVAYDAGTEINTEKYEDLVPPCDGLGQTGESNPELAQNGVVRRHRNIKGHGDLTRADHGWDDPVIKVSVERVQVYDVTVENLTEGQLQTPFVFATHLSNRTMFRSGHPASEGLQQLAENGGVPVLAREVDGVFGVGTVAVIGDAPIAPGHSVTQRVVASGGFGRASLAAMLICTNDGFAGVDTVRLPRHGETVRYTGNAYDAGTEVNTEAYQDLVPPCDGKGQTGETDPALAEGGVVHPHEGIAGGADLDPAVHGWRDPVVKVTITAH